MTLEQLQNQPVMVKVINNPNKNIEQMKEMVGCILEVRIDYKYNKTMSVWNKNKSDYWPFKYSDAQFMTPVFHNGVQIGIGDTVEGKTVYGFLWFNGKYVLQTVRNNDFDNGCWHYYYETEITSHTPLHTTKDDEVEKAIKLLTDKGVLVDGKVLK